MIERDSIERLKQIVNIVDVVGNYLELRRAGANWSACCPFHSEKTPSFMVSPARGYFKCYGCGVGGNSIDFIMQKEHMEFYEAVEKLAQMYNFTLTYTSKRQDSSIYEILDKVAKYYQKCLNSNEAILQYLKNRGITTQSIEKFMLGFSGEGAGLLRFLNESKIPFDKLTEIGLLGRSNRGFFAKFTDRIMFPIHTPQGKIIGFGGRILEGNIAKYINSAQSKIFNKSQILYGYNLAKESIFREKKIIITEGYIDTIMMSQAGFGNCVATLGTALTREHLPLISKSQAEIALCYDGDSAGINAAFKAAQLLAEKVGGVVIFPNGKDPADMVVNGEIKELMRLLEKPTPFIEFVFTHIAGIYDLSKPLYKQKALGEIMAFYRQLSPVLQTEYRDFIADLLQIPARLISAKSTKIPAQKPRSQGAHIVEEILIKSILENHHLLDLCLEYVDWRAFAANGDKFKLLLAGDFEHQDLLGILINPAIKALSEAEFTEQLRAFIINAYQQKLSRIKDDKSLPSAERIRLLKDIQSKLTRLRQGTLVKLA